MKLGLPKKYAKLGFKKGWAKYKAAKKAAKSARVKTVKKVSKKIKTGVKTMPKKSMKKAAAKIKYRAKEVKPVQLLINALIASGGGIATSFIVNKAPVLKSLDPKMKSAAQVAAGLAALFFLPKKFKPVKMVGVGAVTAGTFGLVQKFSNLEVLAGEETLTEAELAALMNEGYLHGPQDFAALSGPQDFGYMSGENPNLMGMNPALMGQESGFQL